jgi:hypothetical protein
MRKSIPICSGEANGALWCVHVVSRGWDPGATTDFVFGCQSGHMLGTRVGLSGYMRYVGLDTRRIGLATGVKCVDPGLGLPASVPCVSVGGSGLLVVVAAVSGGDGGGGRSCSLRTFLVGRPSAGVAILLCLLCGGLFLPFSMCGLVDRFLHVRCSIRGSHP